MNKLLILAAAAFVLIACGQQTPPPATTTEAVVTDTTSNVNSVAVEAEQAAQDIQQAATTDTVSPSVTDETVNTQSAEARVPSDQQY